MCRAASHRTQETAPHLPRRVARALRADAGGARPSPGRVERVGLALGAGPSAVKHRRNGGGCGGVRYRAARPFPPSRPAERRRSPARPACRNPGSGHSYHQSHPALRRGGVKKSKHRHGERARVVECLAAPPPSAGSRAARQLPLGRPRTRRPRDLILARKPDPLLPSSGRNVTPPPAGSRALRIASTAVARCVVRRIRAMRVGFRDSPSAPPA
jgi:hypothetical protein